MKNATRRSKVNELTHHDAISATLRKKKISKPVGDVRELELLQIKDASRRWAKFPLENPNPVLRTNRDGVILNANPTALQLLKNWNIRIGDVAPRYWRDLIAAVIENQSRKDIDITINEKVYTMTLIPNKNEGHVNIYGRDVTDQSLLRESEQRFREIAERSFDAIVMLDSDGRVTYASPALFLITGYSPSEVLGKHLINFLKTEDIQTPIRGLQSIMSGEVWRSKEMKITRNDGSIGYIEINASPIIKDNGLIAGVQAIIRDVSERHKLTEMKEQFISAVTHELRTPLVSIVGYLELIQSDPRLLARGEDELRSHLEIVKRNSDRLLYLTNELLDLRRLESGRFRLEQASITDFREVVKHCLEEAKALADERKQSMNVKMPEEPIALEGDSLRLGQVLTNLINNAIKFTRIGGEVTITAKQDENSVAIHVSDTGIGIVKKNLARVFEPFASIQKPSYVEGTGLGLSLCKGLIEAHGGRIWAESAGEGEGATFTFTIPKRKVSSRDA